MIDWVAILGVVWMFLVAAIILLALFRISAAMYDQKVIHSRITAVNALHAHLRHVIHSEDRAGVALTITAFICGIALAFMLADQILRGAIQKLVQLLAIR